MSYENMRPFRAEETASAKALRKPHAFKEQQRDHVDRAE